MHGATIKIKNPRIIFFRYSEGPSHVKMQVCQKFDI